eukprot:scaffold16043_cov115-Isochrysis_galbana.AAC.4
MEVPIEGGRDERRRCWWQVMVGPKARNARGAVWTDEAAEAVDEDQATRLGPCGERCAVGSAVRDAVGQAGETGQTGQLGFKLLAHSERHEGKRAEGTTQVGVGHSGREGGGEVEVTAAEA